MCGLSRKQKWRRQTCLWAPRPNSAEMAPVGSDYDQNMKLATENIERSETVDTEDTSQHSDDKCEEPEVNEKVATQDELNQQQRPAPRRVHFFHTVQVVLIPCVQEYKDAKIMGRLWWTAGEIQQFEFNMIDAVRNYMYHNCCDYKDALAQLTLECDSNCPPAAPAASPPVPRSIKSTLESAPISCKRKTKAMDIS